MSWSMFNQYISCCELDPKLINFQHRWHPWFDLLLVSRTWILDHPQLLFMNTQLWHFLALNPQCWDCFLVLLRSQTYRIKSTFANTFETYIEVIWFFFFFKSRLTWMLYCKCSVWCYHLIAVTLFISFIW